MTYQRVIPRDLFNEASLMKCVAKVYLNLEISGIPGVELYHRGDDFVIEQNPEDGSISFSNILLKVQDENYLMHRPLNSREPWPLYIVPHDNTDLEVFNDQGRFTPEFIDFLKGQP